MKKDKAKYGAVLVVTIALVFSASFALAGRGGWGRGMGGGGMGGSGMGPGQDGWGQGMGLRQGAQGYTGSLTTEQSQKLQTLREAYLQEITPLRNQLSTKNSEMRLLWAEAAPDQEKIMAKQKEMNELQQQIREKATKHQLEARSIVGK